jgi:hypothetical protein
MQETVEIAIESLCAQWFSLGLCIGVLLTLLGKALCDYTRKEIEANK